ncbi:zinc ion binding [Mactra antiquata]
MADGQEIIDSSSKDSVSSKRKFSDKDDRVCRVCGDKALGFNFNAMTCESCKAFFRRNAIKDKVPACLFQGNCVIDQRTRRFCSNCRLNKCYEVGMKREMILDDTEKKARMQKVIENRMKKRKVEDKDHVVKEEAESVLPDQSDTACVKLKTEQSEVISPLLSSLNETPEGTDLACNSKFATAYYNDIQYKDANNQRILTLKEYVLFEELGEAYSKSLGELLTDKKHSTASNYKDCNDLINNSAVTVLRLISFVKGLEDFVPLNTDEKTTILKSCVLSSILLRSARFYNPESDAWMSGSGEEICTSILLKSTGYAELHVLHTNFCRSLKSVISNNLTLFGLMQVLCVFNPAYEEHVDKKKVSDIQDKYLLLLKHYLEWCHSYEASRKLFAKLVDLLVDLKDVSDAHNAIILQANLLDIEPLMLEVLNLK